MPIYHFDIRQDGGAVIDDGGVEVIDLSAAEILALETLGQAILDDSRHPKAGLTTVEVRERRRPGRGISLRHRLSATFASLRAANRHP